MRVKITQPGWESYSDYLFGVKFENAVAQDEISRQQALQLGAMMAVVEVDADGKELGVVNPAHELVLSKNVSAEVVTPMKSDAAVAAEREDEPETPASEPKHYTEAELEQIASEKGINGLREIGTPLGVKDTSVKGLIRQILGAQGGH